MAVFDLDILLMVPFFICFGWCYVVMVRAMFHNGSTAAAILAIIFCPVLGTLIGLCYAWTKAHAWATKQIAVLWTTCIAAFALFIGITVAQESIPGATSELLLKKLPWSGILLVIVRALLTIGFVCVAVRVLRHYHRIQRLVQELREKPCQEGVGKVARFGSAAVPALLRLLADEDPEVRAAAEEAVRLIESVGVATLLLPLGTFVGTLHRCALFLFFT